MGVIIGTHKIRMKVLFPFLSLFTHASLTRNVPTEIRACSTQHPYARIVEIPKQIIPPFCFEVFPFFLL